MLTGGVTLSRQDPRKELSSPKVVHSFDDMVKRTRLLSLIDSFVDLGQWRFSFVEREERTCNNKPLLFHLVTWSLKGKLTPQDNPYSLEVCRVPKLLQDIKPTLCQPDSFKDDNRPRPQPQQDEDATR